MNKQFHYSVLRYVHSQVTGEIVNLGILFAFPEQNRLVFSAPSKLNRLKSLYINFSEKPIKTYLRAFTSKAESLSTTKINLFSDKYLDIIRDEFLIKDASGFQFSDIKTAVLFSNNVDSVIQKYNGLFLGDYNTESENVLKHNESYVISKYTKFLFEKDSEIEKLFKKDIVVKNEKAFLKADLVWQNGTTNIVKALSFDLTEDDKILDKALLHNAKLNFLEEEARNKNLRFDFLIGSPQDRKHFSAYEQALEILSKTETPKNIITEDKLAEYCEKTLEEVER